MSGQLQAPPWAAASCCPVVIGVAGETGSGKTTVVILSVLAR